MTARFTRPRAFTLALPLAGAAPAVLCGCLTLRSDHDELAQEVMRVRKQVAEQESSMETVRSRNADLGMRLANLELEIQRLSGATENTDFVASAAKQELLELRRDIDTRLQALEEKLSRATNIPETREGLVKEARRLSAAGDHAGARRLYRTYETRYPSDDQLALVRFEIGKTFFSEGDYRNAIGEFSRVIAEHRTSPNVHEAAYYAGLSFAQLGQCKAAVAYFDAVTSDPKAPRDARNRARDERDKVKRTCKD